MAMSDFCVNFPERINLGLIVRLLILRAGRVVTSHTGTDKPTARQNCLHRWQEFPSYIRLEDVPACAAAQGLLHDVTTAVFAYKKDFRLWSTVTNAPSSFNSIYGWESDIH